MYLIHRTRVATAEAVNAELADLGLNGTLSLILETIFELGETNAAELARRCLVTRQALTGPLNDLQSRGLVQRPEPSTRVRVRPITLTAEGREAAGIARLRVGEAERRSIASFEQGELDQLRRLLTRHAAAWEELARDGAAPRGRAPRSAW
ncbi:MarR family winged helix-turn-helix transcriptional regulator [Nonomuraea sp. NEAU-A123]|uniref:MarR family winged helix-turn-helix transcriptional regulator n=1 Tax=Nonomuraea sp. NEAU-A123 TaxID=2839649 RepID=UPI001BE45A55|nr:MarR family transcriptional regulator [Nonomuraea sp. NEAU-A123]MBT2225722.1 MarR family transcriptional regulator [Nonomuraea sp. NEAU-A123]